MNENTMGPIRSALAVLCHHCPMCKHARGHPESVLGKVLHHRLHADYCPMWKAERQAYGVGERHPKR
jgi:hypothetical protein